MNFKYRQKLILVALCCSRMVGCSKIAHNFLDSEVSFIFALLYDIILFKEEV